MTDRLDSQGIWQATGELPEQLAAAAQRATSSVVDIDAAVSNVVVLGAGPAGLAGDVVAAFAAPSIAVPLVVAKSASLPRFVGPDSVVFAVSWNGETPSTLRAAEMAWEAGANVVVVSGGGRLAEMADRRKCPRYLVPPDLPQPRTALGALVVPLLVVLEQVGLLVGARSAIDAAVVQLVRRRDELARPDNVALDIARRIGRTFSLIHGADGLTAVAAQRWKSQINENAKSPAFWSMQPDLCHNELAGWGQSGDVTRQLLTMIELRSRCEDPFVRRSFELAEEAVAEVVADLVPVWADGDGALARFFDHVLVGDMVSLHLAQREGVDPGPVPVVDAFEHLVETSHGTFLSP